MNDKCLKRSRREETPSLNFNPRANSASAGMSRNSGSAFKSSSIGRANKLVQFKKRSLFPCSLKAAYTKTYEKNLGYKEYKNTKTSPPCFSPSCYTFIKEGVRWRRRKERCLKSLKGGPQFFKLALMPNIFIRAAPVPWRHVSRSSLHLSLLQPPACEVHFPAY